MIQSIAQKMLDLGIKPELEVFDLGMINYAHYLISKGLIKPPYYFNIILGNIASAQADIFNLSAMIRALPSQSVWSVGGFGAHQLPMNVTGILAGGGARIGLEDNLYLDTEREHLATNVGLVSRLVKILGLLDYEPYSISEARRLLGLDAVIGVEN